MVFGGKVVQAFQYGAYQVGLTGVLRQRQPVVFDCATEDFD